MCGAPVQLVEAAEAKAIYGLSLNYKCLQALTERLMQDEVVNGAVVDAIWKENGLVSFPDPFTNGFQWDEKTGQLRYPGMPEMVSLLSTAASIHPSIHSSTH